MAELVDALVSGTSGATLGSSSLLMPTMMKCVKFWGCSSVDRALRSHRRGRGFESHQLHHQILLARTRKCGLKKFECPAVASFKRKGSKFVIIGEGGQKFQIVFFC